MSKFFLFLLVFFLTVTTVHAGGSIRDHCPFNVTMCTQDINEGFFSNPKNLESIKGKSSPEVLKILESKGLLDDAYCHTCGRKYTAVIKNNKINFYCEMHGAREMAHQTVISELKSKATECSIILSVALAFLIVKIVGKQAIKGLFTYLNMGTLCSVFFQILPYSYIFFLVMFEYNKLFFDTKDYSLIQQILCYDDMFLISILGSFAVSCFQYTFYSKSDRDLHFAARKILYVSNFILVIIIVSKIIQGVIETDLLASIYVNYFFILLPLIFLSFNYKMLRDNAEQIQKRKQQ